MTNEEMSIRTKKALATALKKTMEKKTLSKITVSELVQECDVNRKTFYYHFQDIYGLLKWMLEEEAIEVVKNFDLVVNTEEAIRFVMEYVEENQHIINCAYDSMGHEEMKRFLYTDIYGVLKGAIKTAVERNQIMVPDEFIDFLTKFFAEACAGMLIEWVKNRLTMDKEVILQNILLIFKVSMPEILKAKAAENQHPPMKNE